MTKVHYFTKCMQNLNQPPEKRGVQRLCGEIFSYLLHTEKGERDRIVHCPFL